MLHWLLPWHWREEPLAAQGLRKLRKPAELSSLKVSPTLLRPPAPVSGGIG